MNRPVLEALEARALLSISFTEITAASGLSGLGAIQASWADYNKDGYVDVWSAGRLYRNNGNSTFTQVNVGLPGAARGGIWGDFDNDGWTDLYLYYMDHSPPELFRNVNGTSFTSASNKLPNYTTLPMDISKAAVWGDWNGDGYIDLYLGGYEDESEGFEPEADAILINNAANSFTLAWTEPGSPRPTRGVTAADFDEDGDMDIFASTYRLEADYLWRNNGSGVFTDAAASLGVAGAGSPYGHGIGSSWGDLDSDGHLDLFVGNFAHPWGLPSHDTSRFYRNRGPANGFSFEDKSATSGFVHQESFGSPALGDFDNDGYMDFVLTTVPGYDNGDQTVLYRNNGDWTFTNVTATAGIVGDETYQASWADIDNDGDLDLLTGGKLYRNNNTDGNYLKVRLVGGGSINKTAVGAVVRVTTGDGKVVTRQVDSSTGEGNGNELTLHFGLGSAVGNVTVEVTWPNGSAADPIQVAPNQTISVGVGATVPYSEDFNDGTANHLQSVAGTWQVASNRFQVMPTVIGQRTLATLSMSENVPSNARLSATMSFAAAGGGFGSNGLLIFDYTDADNYKYAFGSPASGQWGIGEVLGGSVFTRASVSETVNAATDYAVEAQLRGTKVRLRVNGLDKVSYDFGSAITDGTVALGTISAAATFDDVSLTTLPVAASLPYSESFNDGTADYLQPATGTWQVLSNRYRVTPTLGQRTASLLQITDALPTDVKLTSILNFSPAGAGFSSNGLLIFDYADANNYKYAFGNPSISQWGLGEVVGGAIFTRASVSQAVTTNTDHAVEVQLRGNKARLFVGGVEKTSYDFGQPLTDGSLGLGTINAVTNFDDVAVVALPPAASLPYSDNFDDGVANYMTGVNGTWQLVTSRYRVTPATLGQRTMSVLQMGEALPANLKINATVNANAAGSGFTSNALVIFDYVDTSNYKYAFGSPASGQWGIGEVLAGGIFTRQAMADSVAAGTDYALEVRLEGTQAKLLVGGVLKSTYDFGQTLTDGAVGLGTINAVTHFDNHAVSQLLPYPLGDLNLDGSTTNTDIQAMLDALVDMEGYKSSHGLSDEEFEQIADIDQNGSVTNADIQALMNLLTSGGGMTATTAPAGDATLAGPEAETATVAPTTPTLLQRMAAHRLAAPARLSLASVPSVTALLRPLAGQTLLRELESPRTYGVQSWSLVMR